MVTPAEQDPKLYRLLVENSLGLMCIHDMEGVLLTINPAAAQSLGYRVEECCGRNIREVLAPSVRHLFLEETATNSERKGDYYDAACGYAMLGKNDAAFAALDKAEVQRQYMLHYIKTHPELDNIRSDPRYANLLRKIGLPE